MRRATQGKVCKALANRFLSTLSLRRATIAVDPRVAVVDFYPRSPCGERRARRDSRQQPAGISIHALLAESDEAHTRASVKYNISIHALLAESDHQDSAGCHIQGRISIHALLAESDYPYITKSWSVSDFYPRSPCGERPANVWKGQLKARFLSTLSLRRATAYDQQAAPTYQDFYPRSPCGERRLNTPTPAERTPISIHALLAESDWLQIFLYYQDNKFLSTLSLRRATNDARH